MRDNPPDGGCRSSPSGPRGPDPRVERGAVPHAGSVLLRTTAPALALGAGLLTGCSGDDGDCAGATYDVDAATVGAKTPIDALDAWLANPVGFDDVPPNDEWFVQGGGAPGAAEVVILNEATGDGWWVHVVRVDDGGYVVDQATDDWTSCQDELA